MNIQTAERNIKEPFIIDGRSYNLSDLDTVHSAWTPMLWTTESLYRIDEDEFLSVCKTPLLHRSDKANIYLTSRLGAIDAAIKMKAPDSVLESLGVDVRPEPDSPEKFDRNHRETELVAVSHPNLFWYNCLYINHDGSLYNNRLISLEPLPLHQDWSVRLTQRQAIRFALRRLRSEHAMKSIGVRF